jgi:hypothetical protein
MCTMASGNSIFAIGRWVTPFFSMDLDFLETRMKKKKKLHIDEKYYIYIYIYI